MTPVTSHSLAIMMSNAFLIPVFQWIYNYHDITNRIRISYFQAGILFAGLLGMAILIMNSSNVAEMNKPKVGDDL